MKRLILISALLFLISNILLATHIVGGEFDGAFIMSGYSNSFEVTQQGDGNFVGGYIMGSNNSVSVTQIGDNNSAIISQN